MSVLLGAVKGGRYITNDRARTIASHWYDGMWSALYSFASTGRILKDELTRYNNEIYVNLSGNLKAKDKKELTQLINYINKEYARMYLGKKYA